MGCTGYGKIALRRGQVSTKGKKNIHQWFLRQLLLRVCVYGMLFLAHQGRSMISMCYKTAHSLIILSTVRVLFTQIHFDHEFILNDFLLLNDSNDQVLKTRFISKSMDTTTLEDTTWPMAFIPHGQSSSNLFIVQLMKPAGSSQRFRRLSERTLSKLLVFSKPDGTYLVNHAVFGI